MLQKVTDTETQTEEEVGSIVCLEAQQSLSVNPRKLIKLRKGNKTAKTAETNEKGETSVKSGGNKESAKELCKIGEHNINKDITTLTNSEIYSRKDIPIEDIIEYRSKGLSCNEIGKILNCSATNVFNRLKASGFEQTRLKNYNNHKTAILDLAESKLINHIVSAPIKQLSVKDSAITYAILFDKNRLEQGKSTGNLSIHADIQAIKAMQADADNQPIIELETTTYSDNQDVAVSDRGDNMPDKIEQGLINKDKTCW